MSANNKKKRRKQPERIPISERLSNISQRWFLTEPLLFGTFCTHQLYPNEEITLPMRTGKGRVEFNPLQLEDMSDKEVHDRLRVEMIRILLKHPYERQPYCARPEILYLASNATIYYNSMGMDFFCYELLPKQLIELLPKDLTFEEYYEFLCQLFPIQDQTFGMLTSDTLIEATTLWEEDSLMEETINSAIWPELNTPNSCSSLPAQIIEAVKASLVPPINIENILRRFKKSVLSQRRILTRMRPNRRYAFEQMGSRYAYISRILVAIDVSGSVNRMMSSKMLGMINRIFKQGILAIDVVQFDTELKLPVEAIKKIITTFKVTGRGGTDFQPVADYYIQHPEYNGLIYITDGEAPDPQIPAEYYHLPVTWLIVDNNHLIPNIRHGWNREEYKIERFNYNNTID